MIELGACAKCKERTFVVRGESHLSLVLDSDGEVVERAASDGFDGDVECVSCGETHKKLGDLSKEDAAFIEGELFAEG